MVDLKRIYPWSAAIDDDEEWGPHSAKKRAIKRTSPAQQAREKNIRLLSGVVSGMMYPVSSFQTSAKTTRKGEYPYTAELRLFHVLRRYCTSRETQQTSCAEEEENLLNVIGPYERDFVLESCEIAKWPYKLGAALYLHQQMAVREKSTEPSQSKAQWLVPGREGLGQRVAAAYLPSPPCVNQGGKGQRYCYPAQIAGGTTGGAWPATMLRPALGTCW